MDGVGKSTITKRVSKTLDIPLVEKPIDRLLCLDKEHSNIITEKIYSDYSSNVQGMYYLLGYSYYSMIKVYKLNDYKIPIQFLEKSLTLNKKNKSSYNLLGKIYEEHNRIFFFFINDYLY